MNCERVREELALIPVVRALGEFSSEIRAHVATCAQCERNAVDRIAIDRVLDRMPVVEPAATFARAVRARIENDHRDSSDTRHDVAAARRARLPRRVVLAAAAAMVLIVAFAVSDRTAPPRGIEPDDDMLAQLDLLMNWELIDRHSAELDLIGADDLLQVVETAEEGS